MLKALIISLTLCVTSNAAFFEDFPGFEELFRRAKFVGVVTLVERAPGRNDSQYGIKFGPHRLFRIDSIRVLKGSPIQGQVARLADRRLRHDGDRIIPVPFEDILTPEMHFLVFLEPATGPNPQYKWDDLKAEGAVLPVSPTTNLDDLEKLKPAEVFEKVIRDYTAYCKALYEHAKAQEAILDQNGQQAGAGQPANASESKPDGSQNPQPKSKPRSR